MIKRIFTLVAAVALLAACETASTTDSSATGSTTSAATSGTATATSSTAATTTSEEAVDPAEMMKKEFTKVGTTVLFDFDSSQLSDYARRVLDRQAAFLKAEPAARIILGGHADERGTREYNLALSERRANSARNYLISQGVPANLLETIGYGKERPVSTCANESCYSLNRRASSVIE